ncbi:AMP-binding protein [Cellulosimicrobium sp. BIT-GX5]|uniref:AMP-binding protein n=1 Tax=Cellulosimicrobium composti TaxID=2672572 RepID=A0A6N7ZEY1_9MICO|nr:AMP-binding protein [Cellulosimicrobium composti]MTG88007.1 AMP-binding protein [Cellulosimicrobium composti]
MNTLASRPWTDRYSPGVPTDVTVPDEPVTAALYRAAERWPDRVAVDFFGATTTYARLVAQVESAASALHDLGVRRGDRVALVLPNCTSHVVAFYAVERLGAVVVEHNPTYTAGELAHQLADSGTSVAVVWTKAVPAVLEARAEATALRAVVALDVARDLPRGSRLALRLPVARARAQRDALRGPVPAGVPDWHDLVRRARALPPSLPHPAADDVALLQYTGGTTGTPKGAVLTHCNLVANVVQGQAWASFAEGAETVYGVLPFFHAFGLTFCLTLPARIGATLVAFPKFDPKAFVAAQARRPATFLPGVAPMFDRIVDAAADAPGAGGDLTSIRLAFAGAMPITAETAQRWEDTTGGLLIEGYGMTETSPVSLGNPVSDDRRPGTLGLPFPSTEIRVVDADALDAGELRDAEPEPSDDPSAPRTVRGELLVRGPQVFRGYWNRPEETAQQLLDGGWLRTGDVVRVPLDGPDAGLVTLVDRIKEMIVTGGFKVYPSQVEDHLRDMPGVRDVAVVGVPGSGSDEHVAAVVVLDDADGAGSPPRVDLAAVREWGEQRLARYALPRTLAVVPELPRSQIGKVLRRVVREDLLGRDDVERHGA